MASAAATDAGRVRTNNEDNLCVRDADGVWAVADGMGGHEHGERASAAIVDELGRVALTGDLDARAQAAADAIARANAAIWSEGAAKGHAFGSTVVGLVAAGERFAMLWVGDSRGYRFRDGALEQVSRDHSQVQDLVDRGVITAEQANNHPMGHILTRAVGTDHEVEIDVVTGEILPGDLFLLCSDGLGAVVADREIEAVLRQHGIARACHALLTLTLERGAPDNVTLILVEAFAD